MFRHYAPNSTTPVATTTMQGKRCEYCRLWGHVKSECCRLIEKNKNMATYGTKEKKNAEAVIAEAEESQSAFAFSALRIHTGGCILDSGCREHMFGSASGMINLRPSTRQITVADGKTIIATQTGDLVLKL
jgi:hypothetical protein